MNMSPFSNVNDEKALIREVQEMLYYISFFDKNISRINPDGIYGSETRDAVNEFQGEYGLSQTGEVDYATWNRLYEIYSSLSNTNDLPLALRVFPNPPYTVKDNEESNVVYIIQIIINTIAYHTDIPTVILSGIMDNETQKSVTQFQKLHRLPETGQVDKRTWNALSSAYSRYEQKGE